MAKMDIAALDRFVDAEFQQARALGAVLADVGERAATLHLDTDERHLRPGGTVSGPTLMTLADTASYLALLSEIGPVALAVTTSLTIHFMRKPSPGRIIARAELMKVGARLAVAQVTVTSAEMSGTVAHATVTYSIPPGAR